MAAILNPYLNFKDNAKQAMEFYRSIFGGKLTMSTFKEFHATDDPSEENKIMHSELDNGDGIKFFASDTPNRMEHKPGKNVQMSLTGDDEKTLKGYFQKLSAGGKVSMPMEKAAWGDQFGMCEDKFGINWMVNITAKK